MGLARYHKEYRQNEVSTSSQEKLILMMYEGAIKFARMAIEGIDSNDISKKGLYIRKTHDIINELSLALDLKKGGEVARRLETLYQYMLGQLTAANIERSDRKSMESIIRVLTTLHGAWSDLFHGNGAHQGEPKNGSQSKGITSKC